MRYGFFLCSNDKHALFPKGSTFVDAQVGELKLIGIHCTLKAAGK